MAIARDPFSVKSITKGHVSCADADYNMQCVFRAHSGSNSRERLLTATLNGTTACPTRRMPKSLTLHASGTSSS